MPWSIYQIECLETGQIYIGQTKYRMPFSRLADHVSTLRNQKSPHPKLQQVWNEYPTLVFWQFRVLDDEIESQRTADRREAYFTLQVPEDKRLNEVSRVRSTVEKYLEVEQLCAQGLLYREVSQRTGVSLGQISKIRKKVRDGLFE